MRKSWVIKAVVCGIIFLFVGTSVLPNIVSNVKADIGDVIREIPGPAQYSGGLTYDGNYLWVANQYSKKIYKINPSDGIIIYSFNSSGESPEGLAWDGNYLWNSDDASDKIYKLNPQDCSIIDSINSPGDEPRDLCWDGTFLWNGNAHTYKIYKLNPSNGSIIYSFNSPTSSPLGLAWDGSILWSSSAISKKIYAHDPLDGRIIVSFDSPGDALSGLAWDGNYLWNLDMASNKIYQIDVGGGGLFPPNTPTITGKINGTIQTSYDYTIQTTDPNQDDVKYYIDWGDNTTNITGLNASGNEIILSHNWNTEGTYNISVKAIDELGLESDWATLTVTMPCSYDKPIPQIFQWLFQRFPHAFPIVRHLLG